MKEGLVSIIIPIYKVEKYMDRCIKSIVNQTYHNLEIILVDDGSPDRCPQKCDEWAAEDSRIKVIHKKNAGAGMARNTGIENAIGEYICFFDSDDYVALDAIEKAHQYISGYHCEMVLFGHYDVDLNGNIKRCVLPQTDKILYQGDEVQNYVLPNAIGSDPRTGKKTIVDMSPWAGMYSMAVIQRNHWRFVSERQYIFEDSYSLLFLYKELTSVAILSEALYFYCENSQSQMHKYQKDRYERIKSWHNEFTKTCDTLGYGEQVRERLPEQFFNVSLSALKVIARSNCDKQEKYGEIDLILKDPKLYRAISDMNIKHQNKRRKALIIAIKHRLYGVAKLLIMANAKEVIDCKFLGQVVKRERI